MTTIANRQVICEVLMAQVARDPDLVVLCTDSRGSASLAPFAEAHPDHFIEMGIAEQNVVSVAAGLARQGRHPVVASPACFLSTRALEQIKVDVAYSQTNVKLIGISGGISYGALGMTHHSLQDIAACAAIPGLGVYLPSDRHQTKWLMEALLRQSTPAYVRIGRNPVPDVYEEAASGFAINRAQRLREGQDLALIACGEMVYPALKAAELLASEGLAATVLDIHAVKPLDEAGILAACAGQRHVFVVEEHSYYGGLGAMVSQLCARHAPTFVHCLALPDEPLVSGASGPVKAHYGLDAAGIARTVREVLA